MRIITKTNTKKKAKNSNEKDYTHTKLTRTRTKSISPSYWWSQVLDSNKQKNDRPRSGAGPDYARYLELKPVGESLVIRTTQDPPTRAHRSRERESAVYKRSGKCSEEFN